MSEEKFIVNLPWSPHQGHGGPAFPMEGRDYVCAGMSVRDYFAAHAPAAPDWFKHEPASPMPAIVSEASGATAHYESKAAHNAWIEQQRMAKFFAWRGFYADAMIVERAK